MLSLRRRLLETQARLEETEQRYTDIKDSFSRYVSTEVVDAIAKEPGKVKLGGEEREVTVLFADIESYSTLAEAMSPTEVIGFLNDYFEEMTAVILEEKGMINEFEGDGILAIFGAPLNLDGHASHALRAARKMLGRVEMINQRWEESGELARWRSAGVESLRIRIGLHSGTVVSGNVGSTLRMKYAVIGDTVNVAARVEALNKTLGTTLLLTSITRDKLEPDEQMADLVPLGSHPVKGRVEALEVWTQRPGEQVEQ